MCSTVVLLTDCCSECGSADAVGAAAGAAVPAHSALQLFVIVLSFHLPLLLLLLV